MSEAVVVDSLIKTYNGINAVDGISFAVNRGDVFALLGPNGAGKTTTIEIIECIRSLTSGNVSVLGNDVTKMRDVPKIKKSIGVLPQDFSIFENLKVWEVVDFFASLYGCSSNVGNVLNMLDLAKDRNKSFDSLSGGMKQRVGIASAVVHEPEIVFLDEPTTGLDPKSRRDVWKFITELKRKGKTIFLTTHYMEEAQVLADTVGIIAEGKIKVIDTPTNLIHSYGGLKKVVLELKPDGNRERLIKEYGATNSNGKLTVYLKDDQELKRLIADAEYEDVEVITPTLEDVFLKVVGFKLKED